MLEDKSRIGVVPIDWQANEGTKWQVFLEPERLIVLKGGNELNCVGVVLELWFVNKTASN
jgi:hypothetical protein